MDEAPKPKRLRGRDANKRRLPQTHMITVRLDAFFHADLLAEARRLRMSLNTLALMKLAIPLEFKDDLPLDI